jgi:hypothetical protein
VAGNRLFTPDVTVDFVRTYILMESNVVPIGRKVQPIANTSYIYLGETSAVIPFQHSARHCMKP